MNNNNIIEKGKAAALYQFHNNDLADKFAKSLSHM